MCVWHRRKEPASRGDTRSWRHARVLGRVKQAETALLLCVGTAA
jgi:hypothetical protein